MDQRNTNRQSASDAVEEIKNKLDVLDTVSEHVVLKKSGRNYWGCCPFHKEKTPSFSVNPEKGIFKCFGCGAGGDAISFLMKINGTTFWETIVQLAQKYGIELPQAGVSSEKTELKNLILAANKETTMYYKKLLLESPDAAKAREYLTKRAITQETIELFNLGYAPNSYDALIKHLKAKKYTDDVLFKAGLTSERSNGNGYIDRFRDRVIVPIQNEKGEFIAFGARALSDAQQPKYLNSPESMVFNKSRTLFAIHQAKDAIKEQDSVILMEGFFDVISAHVHGIKNVVATQGTALTEQHVKLIARYSDSRKIYLAFDSDAAGIAATNRGGEIIKTAFAGLGEIKHFDESFSNSGKNDDRKVCEIRVISPEIGKDPDEFLRTEGVQAYKELMEKAPLLIDYQISRVINKKDQADSPQAKAKLSKEIIPLLSEINNSIIRNEYISQVSGKLGISEDALNTEVKKALQKVTYENSKKQPVRKDVKQDSKYVSVQKNLLSFYFLNNEKITPLCINNYIKEVNLTEPSLIAIKEHIEGIIDEIDNPNELFKELLIRLADNENAKEVLTDLVYSVEDKKELSTDSIHQYIKDIIQFIKKHEIAEMHNRLKNEYYEANRDDAKSAKCQEKVIEFLQQEKAGIDSKN